MEKGKGNKRQKALTSIKILNVCGSLPKTVANLAVRRQVLVTSDACGMGAAKVVRRTTPTDCMAAREALLHSERKGTITNKEAAKEN